jgi:hypothetical protein
VSARASRGCDRNFAITNFHSKKDFTFERKEIAWKNFGKKRLARAMVI